MTFAKFIKRSIEINWVLFHINSFFYEIFFNFSNRPSIWEIVRMLLVWKHFNFSIVRRWGGCKFLISHKRAISSRWRNTERGRGPSPFLGHRRGILRNFVYHRQDSRHSNFTCVEDLLLDSHSDCPERLSPAGSSKLLEAVIVNRILLVTLHLRRNALTEFVTYRGTANDHQYNIVNLPW